MKTLTMALAFATILLAPAFIQSASAAPPSDRRDAGPAASEGSYAGYPLKEWQRPDSW
jgi:hypothetical protein